MKQTFDLSQLGITGFGRLRSIMIDLIAISKTFNFKTFNTHTSRILIHCAILCKKILKAVSTSFYISIRGFADCNKNYIYIIFIWYLYAERFHWFQMDTQIMPPFKIQWLVYKTDLPRLTRSKLCWSLD